MGRNVVYDHQYDFMEGLDVPCFLLYQGKNEYELYYNCGLVWVYTDFKDLKKKIRASKKRLAS